MVLLSRGRIRNKTDGICKIGIYRSSDYKEDLKKDIDHNGVMYANEHLNSC